MISAIFPKVPAVALTTIVTEQTKYINFLGMVDPEIIAENPNRQNIFYTCLTRPYTGDDIIKVLLLLYTAKLQIMRDDASCSDLFQFAYCHCGHCILTI